MRLIAAAVGSAAIASLLVMASPALASTEHNNDCEDHELCLYYNSSLYGAMHDFDTPVSNFGDYRFFGPSFLDGAGEIVKNNAASAESKAWTCTARIYYNSNYVGIYDDVPAGAWRNLDNTYNENASFNWPGSGC